MSWVSPGIRYFSAMSPTCLAMSVPHAGGRELALVVGLGLAKGGHRFERKFGVDDQRAPVGQEARRSPAAHCWRGCTGIRSALRQAVLRRSFPCAPWPKAPRDCLLASTFCRIVTCVARSVMFFCAVSITASRSLQLLKMIGRVLGRRSASNRPGRAVTASSRSCTVCCNCDCALASNSPMAWTRALRSAIRCSATGSWGGFRGRDSIMITTMTPIATIVADGEGERGRMSQDRVGQDLQIGHEALLQ